MKKFPPLIKNYPVILHGGDYNPDQWLDRPGIIDADFRLMEESGCNTFSIGIFSWSALEPADGEFCFDWLDRIMDRLAEHDFRAMLATPSGAMPAWLALSSPEIRRVDERGHRADYRGRHNHCWSSPVYREKVARIDRLLAKRYGSHPALGAWHLSNEYNGECFCELCRRKFQQWLRERYGTLEKLNAAWYSAFWNHRISAWEEINPLISGDPVTLDWRRFTTAQCCDFIRHEVAAIREGSDAPVTTNMMGFVDVLDYSRVAEVCDFISDDVYPEWEPGDISRSAAEISMRHDYHRAMKNGAPFLIMESVPGATNWQRFNRLKRPGVLRIEELTAIGHGADGAMYFQWRKSRGALEKFHGAVVDHQGSAETRIFREVAGLGALYRRLAGVCGMTAPVDAALIFDQENRWAFELSAGPIGKTRKRHLETALDHYRQLWKRHIQLDVIESTADFSRYRLLILPQLFMLKPGVAARLREFVSGGGVVVATAMTGYVDEYNQCLPGGWPGDGLGEVFGIWNEECDEPAPEDKQTLVFTADGDRFPAGDYVELLHARGAETVAVCGSDFYAGRPVVTMNRFGAGRAWYIGCPAPEAALDRIYDEVVREAGCARILPEGNERIAAAKRCSDDGEYIFICNMLPEPNRAILPAGRFHNVETGAECEGEISLDGYGSVVLTRALS